MDHPLIPDIVAFLQAAERWIGDELDLGELRTGERLLVCTKNTHYLLVITGRHTADLTTDRAAVRAVRCRSRAAPSVAPR